MKTATSRYAQVRISKSVGDNGIDLRRLISGSVF